MKYTPTQLVATFNIQMEKEKKSTEDMTIRYLNTKRFSNIDHKKSKSANPLLSLKSDAEMTEMKDSRGRDKKKYNGRWDSKFRKPRSLSFSGNHLNKKNYSRQNAKNRVNKKLLNMTKNQTPTHDQKTKTNYKKYPTKVDLDTTVKPKRNPSED
jgi:hypothetical protein